MIRPALLPIPLQWVCILALHLDLGIFPWIWDAMIADWRELDGQPAAHLGNTGLHTSDSDTFTRAVILNTEIRAKKDAQQILQDQVNTVQSQVTFSM